MLSRALTRPLPLLRPAANGLRSYATAAPAAAGSPSALGDIKLSNIETAWKTLAPQDQEKIFRHLEEVQKSDWKTLSLDEKKAAYYIAFGPHGPREPLTKPGDSMKVTLGVTAVLVIAGVVFFGLRAIGNTPKTMTKEWQEAANEKSIRQKADPFTGITSEKPGKGHIQ
ncbi:cytochrome c oxidase subunit IV [Atractiella rhizophila]|nr:cytochrome c oxidase subunit IV [Atractiella rhizophila]